jgi:hypothetical protein
VLWNPPWLLVLPAKIVTTHVPNIHRRLVCVVRRVWVLVRRSIHCVLWSPHPATYYFSHMLSAAAHFCRLRVLVRRSIHRVLWSPPQLDPMAMQLAAETVTLLNGTTHFTLTVCNIVWFSSSAVQLRRVWVLVRRSIHRVLWTPMLPLLPASICNDACTKHT